MKTFSQFIEEAYLVEMRKEDKVKGRGKTPLYITGVRKSIVPAGAGSGKKWKVSQEKTMNPEVASGRFRQGQTFAGEFNRYNPHPHGKGGEGSLGRVGWARGKKKDRGGPTPGPITTPKQKVEDRRAAKRQMQSDYMRRYF